MEEGQVQEDQGEVEGDQTREISSQDAFADSRSREEYERVHERLYLDVVANAHERLRYARVILVETPLWLLQPGPAPALYRTAVALFEHAALNIINALTDTDSRALSLTKLRTLLMTTCDPAKQSDLGKQVREGFRANNYAALRQRAEDLRDKRLAHFDLDYALDPTLRASIGMTLKEIEELLDRAKGLLHVLMPGVGMQFDVHALGAPEDPMADIILQLMRNSERLAMPEKLPRPEVFAAVAKLWNPEQRRIFNEWRGKIGKATIDFDNLPS